VSPGRRTAEISCAQVSCRPVGSRTRKILVVDDDADLRQAVASCVADLGVEVVEASDGREGLERLGDGTPLPGAILLDLVMPRLDGRGFLEAVRREPQLAAIPVITMTGSGDALAGPPITGRLEKPFDVEELARILVSLCEE
jgi:two-component system, chemotaxis family, chemotaxis protein CheY